MTVAPTSARSVAARVVERVLADGAYAALALDAELERVRLEPRERALATEIVYGVLRSERALRDRTRRQATRKIKPADHFLWSELLVAAYQILLLDRVPSFAAVDAAVRSVKARRGPRVGGFVNAVCRGLTQGEPLDRHRAIVESAPAWLVAALREAVGEAETEALLGARPLASPPVSVRVVAGRALPEWLAVAEAGRISPRARRLPRTGDLRTMAGYAEGAFVVQEEGAQAVALALGARPGERVLDVCAGRGQKTTLLAEQIGAEGDLWATDLHASKLRALEAEVSRLALPPVATRAVDFTVGAADVPDGFDRVLVDAPCTGTGTLCRRPEIARRLGPGDPERLAEVAEAILRQATTRVRPGGRLVFAVCSVLRAECEAVVERVGDILAPAPFDAPELEDAVWGATSVRLLPLAHGTDGYFVASFSRR